jgi:cell division protein FtsL
MTPGGVVRAAVALSVLLAALAFVTWRQSRAFEALAELDSLRRSSSVSRAERVELQRRVQELESLGRVVDDARRRLGMRMPEASEQVMLPVEPTP